MPTISSFDILDSILQKVAGRPTVLEALWDGDTQGWFLILNVYTEKGKFFWKKQACIHAGVIRAGEDIRLFNGEAPPWPEAQLAKLWGQKAAEKYGLTFYFPSDKVPDNNCPRWTQRHLAIDCAACGKSIIPTDNPYLPKDICYHCHLSREQNEKVRKNELYKMGVYGTYQIDGHPEIHNDYCIHDYLLAFKNAKETDTEIETTIFSNESLIALKAVLHKEIQRLLIKFQQSNLQGDKRKFGSFESVIFEGREYELEQQFNQEHRTLSSLIHQYRTFEEAAMQHWTYTLHVVKGIGHRDDAFLRFIHFVSKGNTDVPALTKRFEKMLTELEIAGTLKHLEQIGCITIEAATITITDRGKAIL